MVLVNTSGNGTTLEGYGDVIYSLPRIGFVGYGKLCWAKEGRSAKSTNRSNDGQVQHAFEVGLRLIDIEG